MSDNLVNQLTERQGPPRHPPISRRIYELCHGDPVKNTDKGLSYSFVAGPDNDGFVVVLDARGSYSILGGWEVKPEPRITHERWLLFETNDSGDHMVEISAADFPHAPGPDEYHARVWLEDGMPKIKSTDWGDGG